MLLVSILGLSGLWPRWQDTVLDVILNFAEAVVFVYIAL